MTTSFTRSPAGDQLWNSGRQNWIFGRIGDQEGAISDPELAGIRDALDMFHDNETDLLLADNVAIIVAQSSEDIQLPNWSFSDAKWYT